MTQNLFNEENSQSTQTTDSHLGMLVGPERKYKDAEALAKGLVNLEEHANRIEEENAKLKSDLEKANTVDDVLKRIDESRNASQGKDSPLNSEMNLSQADLEQIVEKAVTGHETKRTREANKNAANAKMYEAFGDKAEEVFKKKATSPALTKVYQDLAETSPEDFLALFIEDDSSSQQTHNSQASSTTSNQTGTTTSQGPGKDTPGTKAYYNEIRRKDPAKFYSRAMQMEIQRAAKENPDLYYGRKS